MSIPTLNAGRLKDLIRYDPDTGEFWWTTAPDVLPRMKGKRAGFFEASTGYWRINQGGVTYYAHRLAWLYVYGVMPAHDIDHLNGNRLDNRIANLRDVPRRINTQNRRRPSARSGTGLLGVTAKPGGRFVAQLTYQGKNLYLGRFSTPEEAHATYLKAKRQLHEGCTI
ncbi:HNH endonuclease [Achromobacter denitrificans]|uniref:HNH endonuclease n=1 Tax=Achromobacter denitrificans TaxID=32002 RepID=A0ABZ3GBZ6_ACHDE